jgi:hypothetical protein
MIRAAVIITVILGATQVSQANTATDVYVCTQQCMYQKGDDREDQCRRDCVEQYDYHPTGNRNTKE